MAHRALTLELASLTEMLKPGVGVDGLLLAAASALAPEPRLQDAVLRLILRHGANVNENRNGVTPLHRAAGFRSPAAVRLLLENGADVNTVDRRTRSTPLHRAVTSTGAPATAGKSEQILQILRLLLAHGADRAIKNRAGKTARDYVTRPEILALLADTSNDHDVETGEHCWISGPRRDGRDALCATNVRPEIDEDVREEYLRDIRGAGRGSRASGVGGPYLG